MTGPEASETLDRTALRALLSPSAHPVELVGVEVECALLHSSSGLPSRYGGAGGVRAVLEAVLREWGGDPVHDAGCLTGVNLPDGGSVTLEHGGQIEYSSPPASGVGEVMAGVRAALVRLAGVAARFRLALVPGANLPFGPLDAADWVPMSRGALMRRYFAGLGEAGSRAPYVMAQSLSTQVTLDYLDAADFTRKLRMQTATAPVVSALLVNSPLHDGRPCGLLSHRSWSWLRMDPRRTGLLPPALDGDVGVDDVIDWALGVPLIHYRRDGRYHAAPGTPFADLLRTGLHDGAPPTAADWTGHLDQLWTDTRVRSTLELRAADGPPGRHLAALPALWTGLTYHRPSCEEAWALTARHTADEHRAVRAALPAQGLDARLGDTPLRPLAAELLRLARVGLAARVAAGLEPPHVPSYLDPLDEIVATGRTFAAQTLTSWHGDLRTDPARYVDAHRI
ncbi:glutamate-cysteine ligase family protein [Streptomyces californicus]|uniref:glutamate-cysteine ligase family protein n=1 Tax=Streptomyces californicus TaxID=67351 RepID=UPI00378A6CFD